MLRRVEVDSTVSSLGPLGGQTSGVQLVTGIAMMHNAGHSFQLSIMLRIRDLKERPTEVGFASFLVPPLGD